jgi:hypothetical protein
MNQGFDAFGLKITHNRLKSPQRYEYFIDRDKPYRGQAFEYDRDWIGGNI